MGKKTIFKVAKSRMQYNKSRTFLTSAAVMLTTMLLMGLASSALGLVDIERQQALRGSNVHATLQNLSGEQASILKNHVDIEALQTNEIFATVEYGKMNGFLSYGEELKSGISYGVGNLVEGHMPEEADEICGPKAFFRRMDIEPAIGGKISISFRPGGKGEIQTREFTICGFVSEREIEGYGINDAHVAYSATVSEKLVQELAPEEERIYFGAIRVKGEEHLSYGAMKQKIEEIAADIGCEGDDINFHEEYLRVMLDPGAEMVGIVAGIALLIIVFSGLVIYSIYYVSVITDVQEIGKLRALGASKAQIKRLLLTEGFHVCRFAILLGLILGYGIPYFLMPTVMNWAAQTSPLGFPLEKVDMFSLPALLAVVAAVLATVYLSLLNPMRMAAKVSPVEAIRYQESSQGGSKRNGYLEVSLFRLSLANLVRNKKRTAVTIVTMGLSCVLFMALAGVLNSMRAEDIARRTVREGEFCLDLDCSWNDDTYPENNLDSIQQESLFCEEFLGKIKKIDGVNGIQREKLVLVESDYDTEMFQDGSRASLSSFAPEDVAGFQPDLKQGEINYEEMVAENGAIFARDQWIGQENLSLGDTITLMVCDGERRIPLDIKICASIVSSNGGYFQIPQEIWDKLGLQEDSTTTLYISAEKNKYDSVKAALKEIKEADQRLILYSLDEEMNMGRMSVDIIKYPMYAILAMIAIIGFMNLLNTMITSIVTRKRELGVLQAIGLSDRQLVKMLTGEGMVFTVGALLAAVTLGNLFGYLLFLGAKAYHFMSLSVYHYPLAETVAMAVALTIGQVFITCFIHKRIHRESLIDRIRNGE